MDRIDQGVNAVLIREASRVAKLMRAASQVFNERCPMERSAEVVGHGRSVSVDVLTTCRASGVHPTIVAWICIEAPRPPRTAQMNASIKARASTSSRAGTKIRAMAPRGFLP